MKVLLIYLAVAFNASALTSYYVDPDWAGTQSGTASQPWASLNDTRWVSINSSLITDAVTVYFPPLKADGTTQQSASGFFIDMRRTNYSANNLTIDGYSFYNSSEVTPNWLANPQADIGIAYTNGKVFKLTGGASSAIGWTRAEGNDFVTDGGLVYCCIESHRSAAGNEPGVGANWQKVWHQHGTAGAPAWSSGKDYSCYVKQNNITFRGFEVTGSGARTSFNGDNFLLEYFYCHDTTTIDPCIYLFYTTSPDSSAAVPISAPTTNIVLRNFRVVNTIGEGLYLGALNPDGTPSTMAALGNQRYGLLVTNFYIYGTGTNGAQGDGIDCKHGMVGLHIVDGEISYTAGTGNGINLPETAQYIADQSNLVERVFVHDLDPTTAGALGISCGTGGTGADNFYGISGLTVRNCVVANAKGNSGIAIGNASGFTITNCAVYNNTVFGAGQYGIVFASGTTNCFCKNNFVFGTLVAPSGQIPAGVSSDYNAYAGTWTSTSEGAHSFSLTAGQAAAAIVSTNTENFRLVAGSPLIDVGETESSFSSDFAKVVRPQKAAWDIGAFEFVSSTVLVNCVLRNFSSQ